MVANSRSATTERKRVRFHDYRTQRLCKFCNLPINVMLTRYGTQLPFDAELLPRDLDPDRSGWIPGMWKIRGNLRMAMAPLQHYGRAKVERVTHVASLHRCPQYEIACQLGIIPAKVQVAA